MKRAKNVHQCPHCHQAIGGNLRRHVITCITGPASPTRRQRNALGHG